MEGNFKATHRTARAIWFHRRIGDFPTYQGRPVLMGCSTLLPSDTPIRLVADYGSRFLVADANGWHAYVDPDEFELASRALVA